MNRAPLSTAALDQLIATLTDIRDDYVLNEERFTDPIDVAEAVRYTVQLVSIASELFVEADTNHPRFASIVSPARKLQGDNPDAIYHFARISGSLGYRITGRIDGQCYTSFTVHGRAGDGGMAGALLGDVNDRNFAVAADGTYELVLSAERPAGGANWLKLHPDAHSVVVRSYYQYERSAQNDPATAVNIWIETLEAQPSAPPLADDVLAERLSEGVAFIRQASLGQGIFGTPSPVPFVSNVPNTLPIPFSFRDSGLPVPGAADIVYSMGRFNLAPGEALVMTGTLPSGAFTNVMLWNKHMQTLDYRTRRSSLNQAQLALEPDGSFVIVVAHIDPGVANWLDCEGHQAGSIFWRFLLPDTDPDAIACRVVALEDARGLSVA